MLLSQAMRKGMEQSAELQSNWITWDQHQSNLQACALGAVYLGTYGDIFAAPDEAWTPVTRHLRSTYISRMIRNQYPELDTPANFPKIYSFCTVCQHGGRSLGNAIIHLVDYHVWTRERIAEWLESQGL